MWHQIRHFWLSTFLELYQQLFSLGVSVHTTRMLFFACIFMLYRNLSPFLSLSLSLFLSLCLLIALSFYLSVSSILHWLDFVHGTHSVCGKIADLDSLSILISFNVWTGICVCFYMPELFKIVSIFVWFLLYFRLLIIITTRHTIKVHTMYLTHASIEHIFRGSASFGWWIFYSFSVFVFFCRRRRFYCVYNYYYFSFCFVCYYECAATDELRTEHRSGAVTHIVVVHKMII